jgi:cytochrome P450
LDQTIERGEMDLAADFSVPLPMLVLAEMIGVPVRDWHRYKRWSDVILKLANSFSRDEQAAAVVIEYRAVTAEMRDFLPDLIAQRRAAQQDDLLTRLVEAEVDGDRLTQEEILGFVQLLLVGGQETTANLINNAILCLIENPDQLAPPGGAQPSARRNRGGLALPLAGSVDDPRDKARRRDAQTADPGGEARIPGDRLREP